MKYDEVDEFRFPDGKSSGGSSFLSRCMAKLLELTEPKSCSGGLRQDFRQLNADGNCDRSNPFYMTIDLIEVYLETTRKAFGPDTFWTS